MHHHLFLAFGLLLSWQPVFAFAQIEAFTTTSSDQGILVSEGDQPVLFYQRKTRSLDGKWPRAGYVHPLYGLDGQILTEDFPADHRHHRGVFWAWHQVLVGDKMIGDGWLCDDFQWDVVSTEVTRQEQSITVQADVRWKSSQHVDAEGTPIEIVREQTRITVYPRQSNDRCIDFEIAMVALVDGVRIGGSNDAKGYGGFSPRIKLNPDQEFRSASGVLKPSKTAMNVGSWINVSDHRSGLTMISHIDNPGMPQNWILRSKRSMQNAVYPGRGPVPISTETPTKLRYRIVVHQGRQEETAHQELADSFNDAR